MNSTYKLNKQGDYTQPWLITFPVWNQSVDSCPVLTVASWPAYRFLRRQVRRSGIPNSLRIFHSLLWSTQQYSQSFSIVNEAEVNVSVEFSWFFYDPMDVGNLISGSAFSKSSLNVYKLLDYIPFYRNILQEKRRYIYTYTHTHTHTHIYIYIYIHTSIIYTYIF